MLSRVTSVSRVAQASCRRFASTTSKGPGPSAAKGTVAPKPGGPSSSAPQTVQPVTQGLRSPKVNDENPAGFDFKIAQMTLPKRMYSKSGVVASRLYALTEFKNPTNKTAEVNKIAEDLVTLNNELLAHPKAAKAFLTPRFPKEQKTAFITAFNKLLKLHPLVQALTLNLVKTNTAALFPKVVEDFLALKDARDDVVKITLTLASKDQPQPKPETIRNLLSYGPKTQIHLSVKYDPSIEGGAIIRAPEKMVDLTFRRELRTLRERLEQQENVARSQKRRAFDEQLAAIQAWKPTDEEIAQFEKETHANLHLQ
jgi:F0F1-type ATP synthase delta subunit